MGGILVAINPFKLLPLYSAATLKVAQRLHCQQHPLSARQTYWNTPAHQLRTLAPHVW